MFKGNHRYIIIIASVILGSIWAFISSVFTYIAGLGGGHISPLAGYTFFLPQVLSSNLINILYDYTTVPISNGGNMFWWVFPIFFSITITYLISQVAMRILRSFQAV